MKKIAILFVLLLVATSVVYAQKVTYHYAKNIVNGVESQITPPKDIIFEFQGNDVFLYQIPNHPFRYRYDHQENGNAVYYQMATEYSNMTLVKNTNSWLIFNSDKSVANTGSSYNNYITVYRKGSGARKIGKMYE